MNRRVPLVAAACLLTACSALRSPSRPGSLRAQPSTQQQAQKSTLAAVELLEAGNEEQAKVEIRRALIADPHNRVAQSLQRQIAVDPAAALGRESFAYTVRPNDTMSGIAGRFLGDAYAFYILARYNGIKVPRQVSGGQVIRIPGKAPAPVVLESRRPGASPAPSGEPAPSPVPPAEPASSSSPHLSASEQIVRNAEAAERAGDLEAAFSGYRRAAALDQSSAVAKAEAVRKKLVARHSANARGALAREDLDGSIRQWDRVLEIDADNETARLERQRAIALKEKVKALK